MMTVEGQLSLLPQLLAIYYLGEFPS